MSVVAARIANFLRWGKAVLRLRETVLRRGGLALVAPPAFRRGPGSDQLEGALLQHEQSALPDLVGGVALRAHPGHQLRERLRLRGLLKDGQPGLSYAKGWLAVDRGLQHLLPAAAHELALGEVKPPGDLDQMAVRRSLVEAVQQGQRALAARRGAWVLSQRVAVEVVELHIQVHRP